MKPKETHMQGRKQIAWEKKGAEIELTQKNKLIGPNCSLAPQFHCGAISF